MALEFRANQLEQISGYKVTGGVITPRGVRFRLAAAEAPDLAQLRDIFGRGVRAWVAGGEVSVEVGDRADRVPLGQVIANRDLPRLTVVMGVDKSGAPLLVDLTQPASRHLLIADAGKEGAALLRTAALSLAMLNRQRDLQLLPIGKFRWESWPHRLALPLGNLELLAGKPRLTGTGIVTNETGQATTGLGYRPALVAVIDNLDGLPPGEQAAVKTLLRTPDTAGVHLIATATNAAAWSQFRAAARPTGEAEMWQFTVPDDTLEIQAATATPAETDAAINHLRTGRTSRVWTVQETLPRRNIIRRLLGRVGR